MTPRQTLEIERAKKAGISKRQVFAAIISRNLNVDEAIWLHAHPDAWLEKLIFKHGLTFADARRFTSIKDRFGLGHCQTLRLLRGEMSAQEAARIVARYRNTTHKPTDQPIPPELLSLAHPLTTLGRDGDMFDHGSRMSGSYGSTQ